MNRAVPVAALAALLLIPQLASAKSNARPGRIYDGKGVRLSRAEALQFKFKISKDGKRVTQLRIDSFAVRCGRRGSYEPGFENIPTARVQPDGSFTATIPTFVVQRHVRPPTGKLVLAGRFVSPRLASGAVRFTGRGEARGCQMSRPWQAKLRPLMDRYVGTTSAGTKASFYRTIEQHSKVANFNFGTISTQCTDTSESVTTKDLPAASVRNGRFTTQRSEGGGDSSSVAGTFWSPTAASGTIALRTSVQVDDRPLEHCAFSGTWTVHRAAHGVIGVYP